MANKLLRSPARRMRKAYWVALRVAFSYLRLYLGKRLWGKAYYDKRIMGLHQRNAQLVKKAVLELQGLFIKVGQLLSILSNFVPEAFQQPLESLQDQIPARPFAEVAQRIQAELGQSPNQLFASFSEIPLAAASIGQAHRASLQDGTEVVVKVQHPQIEKIAAVDLRIINRLQSIISWWFGIKGMDHLYSQVRQMIEEELDFVKEAQAMAAIGANLQEEPGIVVPHVYSDYSSQRVLTTSWQEGVKISDSKQLKQWQVDQEEVVRKLLHAYCQMVFRDGYYHADPHPGNILVQQDGTIVLLDFGAVARLPNHMREGLSELIEGAVRNDTNGMIEASRKMGFIAPGREAQQLAERIIDAMRNFLQQEIKLDGLNFKDIEVDPFNNSLFDLVRNIGLSGITSTIQVPKEYVLLNRMATLLLGISNTLAPHYNPLEVVRPYLQQFVLGEKGDWVNFIKRVVKDTASNLLSIPGEMQSVLRQARQGQLEWNSLDTRQSGQLIYLGLRQLSFALLLIATSAFTYLFWQQQQLDYAKVGAALSGILILLFWGSLRQASRLRHRQGR